MKKVLKRDFFSRNAVVVAEDLLGKYLVRKVGSKEVAVKIVETEAYDGPEDLACHASKGRTKRTEVLFAEPGSIYVYLIYGIHYMLNIVTDEKDYPSVVLIRGVKSIIGPGRVTKQLAINMKLNTKFLGKEAGLWIEDRGERVSKKDVSKTARIGVDYAGPVWSQKLYRFVLG